MLSLLIHEGRMLFHLFRSLLSFSNVLYFSVYKHYTLKCYFYLFDIFCYCCKWDCFLIFIFGLFLTCDFCTLSLYPGTKLNLIISTNSFYWISLDFLHTRSSHLQIEIVSILPQGRLEVSDCTVCFLTYFLLMHPDLRAHMAFLILRNMSNSSISIYFSSSSFKISGEVHVFHSWNHKHEQLLLEVCYCVRIQ